MKKFIGIVAGLMLISSVAFAGTNKDTGEVCKGSDCGGGGVAVVDINNKNSNNNSNFNVNSNSNTNWNSNSNTNLNLQGQLQGQKQGQSQEANNTQSQSATVNTSDSVAITGNTNDITIEAKREFTTGTGMSGPDVRPFDTKGTDASLDSGKGLVKLLHNLNRGQARNMTVNADVDCTVDYITNLGVTTDFVKSTYNTYFPHEQGVIALATCIAKDNATTMAGVYGTLMLKAMDSGATAVMVTADDFEEVGYAKGYTVGFNTTGNMVTNGGDSGLMGGGGPGFTSNWGGKVRRPFMKAVFFVNR